MVNKENLTEHLIKYQLDLVGKTYDDALKDERWYSNYTITEEQNKEFTKYATSIIKKVYKCNKSHTQSRLFWFNLNYGLKVESETNDK